MCVLVGALSFERSWMENIAGFSSHFDLWEVLDRFIIVLVTKWIVPRRLSFWFYFWHFKLLLFVSPRVNIKFHPNILPLNILITVSTNYLHHTKQEHLGLGTVTMFKSTHFKTFYVMFNVCRVFLYEAERSSSCFQFWIS